MKEIDNLEQNTDWTTFTPPKEEKDIVIEKPTLSQFTIEPKPTEKF